MGSQLDLYWEEPSLVRFLRRLAGFARVVVFDRAGSGFRRLPPGQFPSLEETIDDIGAVLDDLGVERAAIFAQGVRDPDVDAVRGGVPGAHDGARPLQPEREGRPTDRRLPVGRNAGAAGEVA